MAGQTLPGDAVSSAFLQVVLLLFLIRFLDVWEREPIYLVVLFAIWGGLFAVSIAAPLNDARLASLSGDFRAVWGAAWVAPTDEEPAKGLALVVAYLLSRLRARRRGNAEFDGPLDGMVYGAAIGLGFGFVEDLLYGQRYGLGVLHLRLGFLGLLLLGHAVFTASFGAGLGLSTWSRTRLGRYGFPVLGLCVAMTLHAIHNGLVPFFLVTKFGLHTTAAAIAGQQLPSGLVDEIAATQHNALVVLTVFDYGTIIAFFAALLYWTRYQRRVLIEELSEEVRLGVITQQECSAITAYGTRLQAYASLLFSLKLGRLHALRRRHQRVTELAFCKWRISRISGDRGVTDRQRERILALRQHLTPASSGDAGLPASPSVAGLPASSTVALAASSTVALAASSTVALAAGTPTPGSTGVEHPQATHDARNSLILGVVGLTLGIFLLPMLASVFAIVIGRRAQVAASHRSVPPGLILGFLGLALWVPIYVVAIVNKP